MAFMQSKNIKVEENEQADYSNVYSKDGRDGEKDHYLEQYVGMAVTSASSLSRS